MKTIKNKKAFTMLYITFIIFVVGLLTFYFYKNYSGIQRGPYFVGESSLEIIKADLESQKDTFFIQQAAKLSASQSIYDLAANGGHYDSVPKFNGYAIWQQGNYPDYTLNFKNYFNKNMVLILNDFNTKLEQKQEKIRFRPSSILVYTQTKTIDPVYFLAIDGTTLKGLTLKRLEKKIDKTLVVGDVIEKKYTHEKLIGFSTINPSFEIDIGYDLEEFNKIMSDSRILFAYCKDNDNKKECIEERLPLFGDDKFKWYLQASEEDKFAFDVENVKTKIIAKKGIATDFRTITYKFALDLSSQPLTS